MKKIERDFLKDFSNSINSKSSYEDIKGNLNIIIPSSHSHSKWRKWAILTISCLLLLVLIGGVYAISKEVEEYNEAVIFFSEHELDIDDLSRKEVKEIHRDITSNSFSYLKTREVISKSFDKYIPGFIIPSEYPTSEEVENLWNNLKNILDGKYEAEDVSYKYDYTLKEETTPSGEPIFDKGIFEKYSGDTLLWKIEFDNYYIKGYKIMPDFILVYGDNSFFEDKHYSWIAAVGKYGNVLWKTEFDNGFKRENLREVIDNKDNTFAVITEGGEDYFCINQIDSSGNIINFSKNKVKGIFITRAARFRDGYLIQYSLPSSHTTQIIKVDKDANIEATLKYEANDYFYIITDMIEYNNKIYLSGYSARKTEANQTYTRRAEIANVFTYIRENKLHKISSEELVPLIRVNYTALLLVCEDLNDMPRVVYTIPEVMGSSLYTSETGELLWDIENIIHAIYSPATSSFTIGGISKVFQYSFNENEEFLSQTYTGKQAEYRR
jgi:hypothetical protein